MNIVTVIESFCPHRMTGHISQANRTPQSCQESPQIVSCLCGKFEIWDRPRVFCVPRIEGIYYEHLSCN